MSKYYTLIVILVGLLLQSCSDESKSTDCSQCAQNTQCETCQECQRCPTCKEGGECPACPAPSCPTCKEGDECPACNCKECPECNTDALNSQLTACNNELTTTKQALKTEQDANESCVGDLDTCNKDLSDLSAKPRSKSGSRLIFKEHKMSDGSVYVEPYPYDTKLGRYVTYGQLGSLQCFATLMSTTKIDRDYYSDENCTQKILISGLSGLVNTYSLLNYCDYPNGISDYVVGDMAYLYTTNNTTCADDSKRIAKIDSITKYDKIFFKQAYADGSGNFICSTSNFERDGMKYISYLLSGREATESEIKSHFVCEE